jgi:hypothetical protein
MRLIVRSIVGEYAITLEDGQRLYHQIAAALANGQTVELDFEGVTVFAAPFCNEAIGQLVKDHDPDDLNRRLLVQGLAPPGLELIRQVVENAKEYYSSPGCREALHKVLGTIAEEG